MMTETWIKLNRKIIEWGWYKDPNTKAVFLHLLLTANIKDKEFLGVMIPRGSVATSIGNLADDVGITYDQARTALNHLKETNEVTITRRPKCLVISIVNYARYQDRPNHFPIKNGEDSVKKCDEDENRPNQIPITKSLETVGNDGFEDGIYGDRPTNHPNHFPITSQSNPNHFPTTKERKKERKEDTPYSPPIDDIDWAAVQRITSAGKGKR